MSALVLHVRLHDGRYHGEGDWPPSPARLFQALVAGAGLGGPIGDAEKEALEWLERQEAPLVAAPPVWRPRRGVLFYMPNNDSDAIAGDQLRMPKIRTATKTFRPYLFDATIPFVYAWPLAGDAGDDGRARAICSLAERLYQLGRGVDMAWAWGEILDDRKFDELLASYPGRLFCPSAGSSPVTLSCPCPGSLQSLERRHKAFGERFHDVKNGKAVKVVFRRPPRPQFHSVSYDSPPARQIYELRDPTAEAAFAPWPLARVAALVVRLRDRAVQRLNGALPARKAEIERVLVGRKPDGTNDGPPEDRVRIIPLPSVGHVHADREIRRVLVEVPPACPLRAADVHWAFSGLHVADVETGEILAVLVRTDDEAFLRHYGVEGNGLHRVWRTVTPAALPERALRRRIDPARRRDGAKNGSERVSEQGRAAAAVCQALRHAGVRSGVEAIRVQREPFEASGARVEAFASGTRFEQQRLWHVEVTLKAPVLGPLLIGDGRFLGLGLMAPVRRADGVWSFLIRENSRLHLEPEVLTRALRRAVMARVQDLLDEDRPMPLYFTGHEPGGSPARSGSHAHLAFVADLKLRRLLLIAPHIVEQRAPTREESTNAQRLDEALAGFAQLRVAGRLFTLARQCVDVSEDPLFAPARSWETRTLYRPTRHARGVPASEALVVDVRAELKRRNLPLPEAVEVLEAREGPRGGITGSFRITFKSAVPGPLLLGRTLHFGGGLFAATG